MATSAALIAAAQPRYRTGEDPAAVTDDHLRAAIANLSE